MRRVRGERKNTVTLGELVAHTQQVGRPLKMGDFEVVESPDGIAHYVVVTGVHCKGPPIFTSACTALWGVDIAPMTLAKQVTCMKCCIA